MSTIPNRNDDFNKTRKENKLNSKKKKKVMNYRLIDPYVSSLVDWDVKPDIRYFLRILPRCVTSTLTPLRAFLICLISNFKKINCNINGSQIELTKF